MNPKKLIVPVFCVLLGCAGGAAMGSVTAQTWPEPANVQRWQQECIAVEAGRGYRENLNTLLREKGAAGWEAFSPPGLSQMCFKRPAP